MVPTLGLRRRGRRDSYAAFTPKKKELHGLVVHRTASDFLRCLNGASRSPHTIRAYAGRVAGFLGWCAGQGVRWSTVLISLSNRRNGTNSAQAFSQSLIMAG
jgi:hypothetical protein